MKKPRRRLALERERDRVFGARARLAAAGEQQRQRRHQAAAPPGLPARIRRVASADREVSRLFDPARVDTRLVRRERRRKWQLVHQPQRSGHVLAQREQTLEQRGHVSAVERVQAYAQHARGGRHTRLAAGAPRAAARRARPHRDERARPIVALAHRKFYRPRLRRRLREHDDPQPRRRQQQRDRRRRQLCRVDDQRRRPIAGGQPWNVRDDRRHVRADVRRLGQQQRVNARTARLEAIAGVAGARQRYVVVARPC